MDRVPMTQLGYDQLKAQLQKLVEVEMPRVQKALGEARELGDLSENSEFDAAREEMWRLDQKIGELRTQLACAQIIDPSQVKTDSVTLGVTVVVEDLGLKRKDSFMIVGEGERRDGVDTVSVASPLGQALVGKKVGDAVEVHAPRGKLRFKVLEIKLA
jgi:transcription elongation factor GreA